MSPSNAFGSYSNSKALITSEITQTTGTTGTTYKYDVSDWIKQNIAGVQEQEQARYAGGLSPFTKAADYYKPGGEYSQTAPKLMYQDFIKGMVGGTAGGLRGLFSTTNQGRVSMSAGWAAEQSRGEKYNAALAALGGATQRYPLMPNFGGLEQPIGTTGTTGTTTTTASPGYLGGGYASPTMGGRRTGGGDGGGGGSSGGGGGGDGGGKSPYPSAGFTPGSSSGQHDAGLYMDYDGRLNWHKSGVGIPYAHSLGRYVGGWEALKYYDGKTIGGLGEVHVDPSTGEVSFTVPGTNTPSIPTNPVDQTPYKPGGYGNLGGMYT